MKTIAVLTIVFLPGTFVAVGDQFLQTCPTPSMELSSHMQYLGATIVTDITQSFFSMGLFNWQADKGIPVVNSRIWIYWAVTIPLTFLTTLIWIIWLRSKIKRHRRKEAEARTTDDYGADEEKGVPDDVDGDDDDDADADADAGDDADDVSAAAAAASDRT